MIKNMYFLLMDSELNGLSKLPNVVKFQLMTILSFMWSIIFTLMLGSFLVLGVTMVLHILFLVGIFFTAEIFKKAKQH